MPLFAYSARKRNGEKAVGEIDAPDRRAVLLDLERQGLIPVSVSEAGVVAKAGERPEATRRASLRMGTRDVLVFTTELSDLLASGMTLGNALNVLAGRRGGRRGDAVVADLRDEIVRGASLSDALARHPRSFPDLYVSMIRAGEASGAMSDVLARLVAHFERVQDVKDKVVMALVYPAIVIGMGALTLIFSMIYVIPKFQLIFQQMGQTLPLSTRILIGTSSWLVRYGWAAAIGVIAAAAFVNSLLKTRAGRAARDRLLLRLPLLRNVVASSIFANLARTLSTLLSNGVPVLDALRIVERTAGNVVIASEIEKARGRVTDGTTISGPLAAGGVFPVMMTDMLAVGEQTGDMSGALLHIARRYENELDRAVKVFTTALEPILIVLVALMVGYVAISILMAVFNLTSGLNV